MSEKKISKPVEPEAATLTPEPVSPEAVEPKQTKDAAKPAPKPVGAKPAAKPAPRRKDSVVGSGDTDPVAYSMARPPRPTEGRKSLTVLHIQRRLAEEGIPVIAPTGRYENTTTEAVKAYQVREGGKPTGLLTREEFRTLFDGDPNVTAVIDSHLDNA